jgi:hypothetical protein
MSAMLGVHHGDHMYAPKFHLTLTVGLSAALGAMTVLALSSQPAKGYPAAAVSAASNPVQAWAGEVNSTDTVIMTAPTDQDIVVTDVHLSCNYACEDRVVLTRSDGSTVGMFWISGGYGSSYDSSNIQQQFSSGIPVPAGQTLSIRTISGYTAAYTLAGYHAQP